jgi:cytochrome c-type biogenesis protein CcmH
MLLWLLFALSAGAVLMLILRVAVAVRAEGEPPETAYAANVYRDQLSEIDRDLERGVISATESDAARNEVGRRLLATLGPSPERAGPARDDRLLFISLAAIPLLAAALYLVHGQPGLPGVPHAERMANAVANRDADALITRVEDHLATHPEDGAGWTAIARAYRSLGRLDEAGKAFAQAIAHSQPEAALLADYGEILVLQANGVVTADAAQAFADALALDPGNPRSRYYAALARAQDGDVAGAVDSWRALLKESPADAPWRGLVEERIAAAANPSGAAPEISDEQIAAAGNMSAGDRQEMIRGMVERLTDRLKTDGRDLDGWLRLARARLVLGEKDKAAAALDEASRHFREDAAALRRIDDMRQVLTQ